MSVMTARTVAAGDRSLFREQLVRRLTAAHWSLLRAEAAGDDLQAGIAENDIEDLHALAVRNDVCWT